MLSAGPHGVPGFGVLAGGGGGGGGRPPAPGRGREVRWLLGWSQVDTFRARSGSPLPGACRPRASPDLSARGPLPAPSLPAWTLLRRRLAPTRWAAPVCFWLSLTQEYIFFLLNFRESGRDGVERETSMRHTLVSGLLHTCPTGWDGSATQDVPLTGNRTQTLRSAGQRSKPSRTRQGSLSWS